MAILDGIREDENSVTVWGRDEYGDVHSETVSHNGSDWDRNNAMDEAMERALSD